MKRKLLLEADLSQAEARAVAYYCGDEGMKNLFKQKIDIHIDRATMILDVEEKHYEYKELKALYQSGSSLAKQYRQGAKAVGVHATNYDVGPRTVVNSLRHHGIFLNTRQEKTLRANTHSRFPGIRLYQYGVQQALKSSRILKTAKGMKRYFFSKLDDNTFRRAYAFLPQCTVAEITNEAIVKMEPKILALDGFVLLQVHDSVLIEVPERNLQEAYEIVVSSMTQPIEVYPFYGDADLMTIPVDVKWGTHWGELKEWID
jgi:DNA polymerase I-like protein with 3'-5' exonuclease and polymerase domains